MANLPDPLKTPQPSNPEKKADGESSLSPDKIRLEEFPNLHTLKAGGKTIHLVGTAHISHKSAEEVEAVIRHVRPDCVA
ncbi:MAG: hypothetical protein OEW12_02855, partial [Deltaproteobacteria bacterium]|nr:hypothetical protein [Deltaproteobacteria bacterium]